MTKYLGIDGCRSGWVVATIENHQLSVRVIDTLQALNGTDVSKAYIDMPLHFALQQYRTCEVEARRLLGHQKQASIFLTPHREAVYATTFADANRINKTLMGKGVSIQAWNIFGKIREAVAFSETNTRLPLQEAHPELCFWFLNKQAPLLSKKSTSQGIADRMKIIESVSKDYRLVIEDTLANTQRKNVKPDDVMDAVVLAIRATASNTQSVVTNTEAKADSNIYF